MGRNFRHWTPHYAVSRLALEWYQRRHPRAPWLTKRACELLEQWLTPSDEGLEWGSGRSTLWLSERVRKLISVEHHPYWYRRICADLDRRKIANVEYHFAPIPCESQDGQTQYVQIADSLPPESLDFVLVDGQHRDYCAQLALALLKPGGLLILDNAEQFLPHESLTPNAIGAGGRPPSERWQHVARGLAGWRCIWTSNGVWDTALFARSVADAERTCRRGAA
jgi:hypothetical protein